MVRVLALAALGAAVLAFAAGCSHDAAGAGGAGRGPKIGFVTNCVAEFWTIGKRGAEQGARECGATVSVLMPPNAQVQEQKGFLEDLLSKGVDGIALSPIDPGNMTELLDEIAGRTLLVTHDSDAPASKRLAYIGVDNYDAGRMCGRMVAEALPDGGAIVVVVGNLDQDNARRRRQGLIDELLGRSHDPARFDSQDARLKGDKYEIRASYTDQFDHQKTKALAEDALVRWSDIAAMVGLFEYEPPILLEAVKAADRLAAVKVVGFDENEATLQGIVDGEIVGTIVQNPYEYGRQSVLLLAALARAEDAAARAALLPKDGYLPIPARAITKTNVVAFRDDLRQKLGK
ncbi:MAG: substrate-binding domain-containing protein [Planctomycetes bacterium]|nr:substrate-binding domain-containing protein [Planctomycetota bacterium]